MNPSEAAAVLARAALYDRRTVGLIESQAWAQALGDHTLDDALVAVDQHYAETDKWLLPVHVNDRAGALARRRIGAQKVADREAQIAAENNGDAGRKAIEAGGPAPEVTAAMRRELALAKQRRKEADAERERLKAEAKAEREALDAALRREKAMKA